MKKIECVIRQEKLKDVVDALRMAGVPGATISEVKGFGSQSTRPDNFLLLPKTKIEIYVNDENIKDMITAISDCCREETMGSGKIVVLPMEDCIRVRTGERGIKAVV